MRTIIGLVAFIAVSLTGCSSNDGPKQPDTWKNADFQEVRLTAYEEYSGEEIVDVWVKGQVGDQLMAHVRSRQNGLDPRFGRAESFEIKRKDGSRRCFPPMVLGSIDKEPYRIGTVHLVDGQGKEFTFLHLLRVPR